MAAAQPAPSDHRTPAGIAFRHFALAEDTYHALAFGWTDGYPLALADKAGVAVLGPRMMLEGSRTLGESARIERSKDLQASLGLAGSATSSAGHWRRRKPSLSRRRGCLPSARRSGAAGRPARLAKRTLALSSQQHQEDAEALASRLFTRLLLGPGPL